MSESIPASDTRSLTDRLLAVPAPLHAALHPDGAQLCLTTVRVPIDGDDEVVELTMLDRSTGLSRALTLTGNGDRYATFAPGGDRLAFLTDRDGTTRLAVASLVTDEVTVLAGAVNVDGPPAWSPNGEHLVVACRRGIQLDRSRPYRWTRPFPAADGLGPLEDPPQLRLLNPVTGEGRWLTDDDWRWATPRWAPDGSAVAATVASDPTDRLGGQSLRIVRLGGGVEVPPVPGGRGVVPAWLDDGRLVVLVTEPHGRPGGSAATLFVVAGSDITEVPIPHLLGDVFGDCPAELADTYEQVMIASGSGVVVRTGTRGRMGISHIDLADPNAPVVSELAAGDRSCSPVALHGRTLIATTQSSVDYPSIIELDLDAATERTIHSPLEAPHSTPMVRRFTTESDGWALDGWFLSAPDATLPIPTVLVIHGGPHFTYGEAFSIDAHALCDAGFGVLYTNPRGSTGYGDAFAHAAHGDWAEGPSRDVLAVVDTAIELGWADAERLGVTGNSYGGYLSAWLASTTDRFRGAVIENPVIDLFGMYGSSDIGRRFFPAQLGGPPWLVADTYVAQSPLLRAHACRTPSLFVVGELDRRCPPAQAWAMHRVLHEAGTPSEVLVLPGSTHEGSTYGPPMGRRAHNEALIEWMRRWVMAPEVS